MSLLYLEDDPWIKEYESCENLQRYLMEQLTERQKYARTTSKYAQISADVRLKLKQYVNEAEQLKEKLDTFSVNRNLTPAESERRARLTEVLLTKATQMRKMFNDQMTNKLMEERVKLTGTSKDYLWDDGEESERSIEQMRSRQQELLGEQNKGLENLSKIISRQKDMANAITTEVEYHNEIITDIDEQMDRADERIREETTRVELVDRRDNTCGYWIVIIVLFISIIVIAAV